MNERAVMTCAPGTGLRRVWEGVRLGIRDGDAKLGTLVLTHGHQGTLGSDRFTDSPRWALQSNRSLQNRFGVGWSGVGWPGVGWFGVGWSGVGWSDGIDLPSEDDALRGEHDLILYDWAERQEKMMLIAGHTHRPVWAARTQEQPYEPGSRPAYVKTGCCTFSDGDITGMEIDDGWLPLIRWKTTRAGPLRAVLQRAPLVDLFAALR